MTFYGFWWVLGIWFVGVLCCDSFRVGGGLVTDGFESFGVLLIWGFWWVLAVASIWVLSFGVGLGEFWWFRPNLGFWWVLRLL